MIYIIATIKMQEGDNIIDVLSVKNGTPDFNSGVWCFDIVGYDYFQLSEECKLRFE